MSNAAILWSVNADTGGDLSLPDVPETVAFFYAGTKEELCGLLVQHSQVKLVLISVSCSGLKDLMASIRTMQDHYPNVSFVTIIEDTYRPETVAKMLDSLVEKEGQVRKSANFRYKRPTFQPEYDEFQPYHRHQSDQTSTYVMSETGVGSMHSARLTPRQRDVLTLIMKGQSNKQIARLLDLTEGTVKIHCMAIFRQLGVTNRTQAAMIGEQLFDLRQDSAPHAGASH